MILDFVKCQSSKWMWGMCPLMVFPGPFVRVSSEQLRFLQTGKMEMVSAALLGTKAIQYLLLALPVTPVGVPPVSMLHLFRLHSVWESVFIPMSASDLAVLGSTYRPFRDRNVLPFPFSGVLPI